MAIETGITPAIDTQRSGLGGLQVGGFGRRLAMVILRLTWDDSVRGIESDDGFIIGRFDLTSTLRLYATTMFVGTSSGELRSATAVTPGEGPVSGQ